MRKLTQPSGIALAAVCIVSCGSDLRPDLGISFQPPLLPVKFTVGRNGITLSGATKLVTPVGTIGLEAAVPLVESDKVLRVIVRDRKKRHADAWDVRTDDTLGITLRGNNKLEISAHQVVLDVSEGGEYELIVNATRASTKAGRRFFPVTANESRTAFGDVSRDELPKRLRWHGAPFAGSLSGIRFFIPPERPPEVPDGLWLSPIVEPFGTVQLTVRGAHVSGLVTPDSEPEAGEVLLFREAMRIEGSVSGREVTFTFVGRTAADGLWRGDYDAKRGRISGGFTWTGGSMDWYAYMK